MPDALLPHEFADLEPFAATWCLATEAERWTCIHESPPVLLLQPRIASAFGADGRAGPVPGQHLDVIREGQAHPRQAVQDGRVVAAGQVGPADRACEQQIAELEKLGLTRAPVQP